MKVSGFELMDRLDALKERATALDQAFTPSLYKFDDETKRSPTEIMGDYLLVQHAIAEIQEAQSRLNLTVTVRYDGEDISLERAIKLLGIAGRAKNQWNTAAGVKSNESLRRRSYYGSDEPTRTRDKSVETAKRQVSEEDAKKFADTFAARALELKREIRKANAREVEIDLDPDVMTF